MYVKYSIMTSDLSRDKIRDRVHSNLIQDMGFKFLILDWQGYGFTIESDAKIDYLAGYFHAVKNWNGVHEVGLIKLRT